MKKILVVEDDKLLANAYRVKLATRYEVIIARDGDEALEILKESTPDLILLDLVLPKRDGFSVLSVIKKDERLKNIPCIVSSNLGQKEDIAKARSLGADDYIVKTDLSMRKLLMKVKLSLGEEEAESSN